MALIDEIASDIFNSKKCSELPTALTIGDTEKVIFCSAANNRVEVIEKSLLDTNIVIFTTPNYLGTVTTAGATTTNTEIKDFINATGFTIVANELKILKMNVYKNNFLHTRQYLFKANLPDTYGTGNTVIVFSDLHQISENKFDYTSEDVTTVPLGDIAPETTIEDFVNLTNDPLYNLLVDTIYIFTATINSVAQTYLYVGTQPLLIGLGNNAVTAADFVRLDGYQDLIFFGNKFQALIKNPINSARKIQVDDSVIEGYQDDTNYLGHIIFTNAVGNFDFNNIGNWHKQRFI